MNDNILEILRDQEEGLYGIFKEYEYICTMTGFRERYLIYLEDNRVNCVSLGAA